MTPPNPFSSITMPGSFLPAIPASLPSYPKHNTFHTPQSPSPTLAPTRKRLQHRRPADNSYNNPDNDRDSDEDVMRNSLYSDTAFRTSLAGHSRKRGLADDDVDDYNPGKRVETTGDDGRPAAKRRIIDVVGSVASRVWEFCISKTPFYSQQSDEMEFEQEVQRHMSLYMPGQYSGPPNTHASGNGDTGMGGMTNPFYHAPTYSAPTYSAPTYSAPEPIPPKAPSNTGGLSSRWVMVSPTPTSARPSTATTSPTPQNPHPSRPYTAPTNTSPHAPYSPTTYATTATSTTTATATPSSHSRRNSTASTRRPPTRPIVASSSRAKRPAVVRHKNGSSISSASSFSTYPAPPSQSAFTFGGSFSNGSSPARASMANTRSRRKLTGGSISRGMAGGFGPGFGDGEDEDEADESIRRFNEKLKDMIREGREALGSRIEVTYDDDDDLEAF